jgi:hypothetical protein
LNIFGGGELVDPVQKAREEGGGNVLAESTGNRTDAGNRGVFNNGGGTGEVIGDLR